MDIVEFAKNEIEIFKKRVAKDSDDYRYNVLCMEAAVEALKVLAEQGHSGMSISYTMKYLENLVQCKVLTPIVEEDEFTPCPWREGEEGCVRYSGLYRTKDENGNWKYHDVNQISTRVLTNAGSSYWHSGFVSRIIEDMFPITLPYMPYSDGAEYIANVYEYLRDRSNGDYDTIYIESVLDKKTGKVYPINRYFTEDPISDSTFLEIDREQFLSFDYLDGVPPITEEDTVLPDGTYKRCRTVVRGPETDDGYHYTDLNRVEVVDQDENTFIDHSITAMFDVLYPITLPYIPCTGSPRYSVYAEVYTSKEIPEITVYHVYKIHDKFEDVITEFNKYISVISGDDEMYEKTLNIISKEDFEKVKSQNNQ